MANAAGIITEAIKNAAIAQLTGLSGELEVHINQGLEAHDSHQLLDVPFIDGGGHTISSKTLRIGIFRTTDNVKVVVDVPAIPQ